MVLDRSIIIWFNSFAGRSPALDNGVALFTNGAPFIFLVLFALYFVRRGSKAGAMRRTVLLSGLSGVVALIVAVLVSPIIGRDRPFIVMPDQIHLLIAHAADPSFPSDHMTGSAAFAFGMWRAPSRSARWLFMLVAVLVGVSRMVAGVHWPSDILGSFILGGLIAYGCFALKPLLDPLLTWILKLYGRLERRPA